MKFKYLSFLLLICFSVLETSTAYQSKWRYSCNPSESADGSRCQRYIEEDPDSTQGTSLAECQLTCGPDSRLLWPLPTSATLAKAVASFNPHSIVYEFEPPFGNVEIEERIKFLVRERSQALCPNAGPENKAALTLRIVLEDKSTMLIRKNTIESYELNTESDFAEIKANNYFGARHAIETFFQMVALDELSKDCIRVESASVTDSPVFPHRGVLVDTSRNFIEIDVIKKIIYGMALSKLNVFHWHLTDSHSFPIELTKYPETTAQMVNYGAYGDDKFYTIEQVKDILDYANIRGVRVIPELDTPAHVGYGWQFPGSEGYTVCVGQEPWYSFCQQPPCGQVNPFSQGMYQTLEELYDEFQDIFRFDSFHMGGDEVSFNCWNSSELVTGPMINNGSGLEEKDFIQVWSSFQSQGRELLLKHSLEELEVIIWTSTLTNEEYIDNLSTKDYTIQIWTDASDMNDKTIKTVAEKGFKMIFSNYDTMYLDCGFGNYVGSGNNWCSPFKPWRQIYENDMFKLLSDHGVTLTEDIKAQVQGAEVAVWSEQTDSQLAEGMFFPRAAAMAERLWTNPDWPVLEAETRMFMHRDRLVKHGIRAMSIQPGYCLLNPEACRGEGEAEKV